MTFSNYVQAIFTPLNSRLIAYSFLLCVCMVFKLWVIVQSFPCIISVFYGLFGVFCGFFLSRFGIKNLGFFFPVAYFEYYCLGQFYFSGGIALLFFAQNFHYCPPIHPTFVFKLVETFFGVINVIETSSNMSSINKFVRELISTEYNFLFLLKTGINMFSRLLFITNITFFENKEDEYKTNVSKILTKKAKKQLEEEKKQNDEMKKQNKKLIKNVVLTITIATELVSYLYFNISNEEFKVLLIILNMSVNRTISWLIYNIKSDPQFEFTIMTLVSIKVLPIIFNRKYCEIIKTYNIFNTITFFKKFEDVLLLPTQVLSFVKNFKADLLSLRQTFENAKAWYYDGSQSSINFQELYGKINYLQEKYFQDNIASSIRRRIHYAGLVIVWCYFSLNLINIIKQTTLYSNTKTLVLLTTLAIYWFSTVSLADSANIVSVLKETKNNLEGEVVNTISLYNEINEKADEHISEFSNSSLTSMEGLRSGFIVGADVVLYIERAMHVLTRLRDISKSLSKITQ
jgi:hypothetical protein